MSESKSKNELTLQVQMAAEVYKIMIGKETRPSLVKPSSPYYERLALEAHVAAESFFKAASKYLEQ